MLSRRCLLESVDDEKPLESTSRHLDTKWQKKLFLLLFQKICFRSQRGPFLELDIITKAKDSTLLYYSYLLFS